MNSLTFKVQLYFLSCLTRDLITNYFIYPITLQIRANSDLRRNLQYLPFFINKNKLGIIKTRIVIFKSNNHTHRRVHRRKILRIKVLENTNNRKVACSL